VGPLAATSSANAHIAAQIVAKAEAMLSAPRAAPGYVRHLFDQFSANYDERMLVHLSYRAPRILRGLADLMLGALDRPLDILDLGCGTGLSGEAFLDLAGRLDGVDLSPRMIERARERGIYDELSVADLETVLHENGPRYDLLIAADTLVYLGDLEPVLSGAASRLKPGGFFLFTVERDAGEAFSCGPKRRYRHGEAYLRDVAMRSRFDVMGLMDCSPRDEAGVPVEGIAVALQRN
jgi:predicted TPR repeat methyltransferase